MTDNTVPHRRIRSYVRRDGRLTAGQQRALDELYPVYGLKPDSQFDPTVHFINQGKTCLEIGFGDGEALLDMAVKNPQNNYLGIEVHTPGVGRVLLAVEQLGLNNVRVFQGDAVDYIASSIANENLDEVYLFFPDPWHKKKHNKRRILQPDFIDMISDKLVEGGIFHFATDWQEYAEEALGNLDANSTLKNCAGKGEFSARSDERILTKFERRGHRLGHGVWDIKMLKR